MKNIRSFLMKPARFNPAIKLDGWFMCEYKHGLRCFWDGGLSRGQLLRDIPWAHTPTNMSDTATSSGLWASNLASINMPDKWLNTLPTIPVEGVIYKEAGAKYLGAVGSPCLSELFKDGPVYHKTTCGKFNLKRNIDWIKDRKEEVGADFFSLPPNTRFERELKFLDINLASYGGGAHLLQHTKLTQEVTRESIEAAKTRYPNGFTVRSFDSVWATDSTNYFLII